MPHFRARQHSCILLTRKDILGQAVSLSEARQPGRWSEHFESRGTWNFDSHHVGGCLAEIQAQSAKNEAFVSALRSPFTRLFFEDMVGSPSTVLKTITGRSEQEISALLGRARPTSLSRQSEPSERAEVVRQFAIDLLSSPPFRVSDRDLQRARAWLERS